MTRSTSRRRWIAALAATVIVGAIGSAVALRAAKKNDDAARTAPAPLQFAPTDLAYVSIRSMPRWLPVSGTLQPVRQAIVKAKVSGEIRQIAAREGDRVEAGQAVARIDTADLDARLIERTGALESARAQLALAEKTRAMNLRLLNDKFISQNAFDNAESSFNVAQGSVKSMEAQVQLAKNAVKDAIATAPLSGTVAKRHVQPGEKVAIEAPLLTIVDLRDLEVQALVPAIDVPELAIGMPVELSVDGFGERRFAGRIERINPATEPGTRAIMVYIALPNADTALRSGMFATGRIALASGAPAPSLPAAAVRTEAGQSFVWVIDNGKLARRVVSLGRRDADNGWVELKAALPDRLPVLAARFDNLRDGAPALVKAPLSQEIGARGDGRGGG